MEMTRARPLNLITERIAWLAMLCKVHGAIHLFDVNTLSHEFFCRLLNEIYDLKLVVMDRIHANFPAIDLGDETNKRSFQITAENGSHKIQTTVDLYVKHGLASKYGKLQVVIIGDKKDSYKNVDVPPDLPFDPDHDVTDINGLVKVIERLGTDKLERIAKIVEAEIRTADFPDQFYLHVSVHNEPREHWPAGDDTRLAYLAEQASGVINIVPFMPYLDKMAAGGPIEPLRYNTPTCCPFDWALPALDFKLLNRTNIPFLLADAIFDVEESTLDSMPLIVVKEDLLQAFAGSFWLVNEGATALEEVVVRFQMLPGNVPAPAAFPDSYPYSVPVGRLDDSAQIEVDGAFAECGVNIEELNTLLNSVVAADTEMVKVRRENGTESVMTWDEYKQAITRAFGPFEDGVGTVIGEIEFGAPLDGKREKRVVRFRAVVYIVNEKRKLAYRPPSAVYQVEFDTTGCKYRRRVPISQEVPPGQGDRFLIKVALKQPSNHRFRVTFRDVGGQVIQSPWIRLRCFVPRTRRGREQAEQASASKDAS